MGDLPYYIDDPLVDHGRHRLDMQVEPVASATAGRDLYVGTCSCGELATPAWDNYAVLEAYDNHMGEVQHAVHELVRVLRRHGDRTVG